MKKPTHNIDPILFNTIKEKLGVELIQIGKSAFSFLHNGIHSSVHLVLYDKWMAIVNEKVIQDKFDTMEDVIKNTKQIVEGI